MPILLSFDFAHFCDFGLNWLIITKSSHTPAPPPDTHTHPHTHPPRHDALQLLANIVCLLHAAVVDKVIVTPARVHVVELEGVVGVEVRQVVPV